MKDIIVITGGTSGYGKAAAKWGVPGFSKGLATELTPDGIRGTDQVVIPL